MVTFFRLTMRYIITTTSTMITTRDNENKATKTTLLSVSSQASLHVQVGHIDMLVDAT